MDPAHITRIKEELKEAGAGAIARLTPESHELAKILHHREHIGGVVYGVYPGGLAWLVATNQRVLFLDRKPLFSTHDELTYDIVVGCTSTRAGIFVTVTLHTRIHDYAIRFVNPTTAQIFIDFVEQRRLTSGTYDYSTMRHSGGSGESAYVTQPGSVTTSSRAQSPLPEPGSAAMDFQVINEKALKFLRDHDLGVLSTVDRTGNADGAMVYYYVDPTGLIYILTQAETEKGRNIYAHGQVALTVYEPGTLKTLQLHGIAGLETDQKISEEVAAHLTNPHLYKEGIELPPVTHLHKGSYMVVRIKPTHVHLHDYSDPATKAA